MRIAGFLPNSLANGEGTRAVVFFAGCGHKCKGCHNKDFWDRNSGENFKLTEIANRIIPNIHMIDGITVSGGEPFLQPLGLFNLLSWAKSNNLNTWVYTGYTYENLIQKDILRRSSFPLLNLIDVLVDGPFVEELKDDNLKYKGSSNQRVLKLKDGKIVEEIYK